MMNIDIDQLAKLANIKVDKTEHDKLTTDVAGILDYVKKIQTVKIDQQTNQLVQEKVVRKDEVEQTENKALIDAFSASKADLLVTPVIGVKEQEYDA